MKNDLSPVFFHQVEMDRHFLLGVTDCSTKSCEQYKSEILEKAETEEIWNRVYLGSAAINNNSASIVYLDESVEILKLLHCDLTDCLRSKKIKILDDDNVSVPIPASLKIEIDSQKMPVIAYNTGIPGPYPLKPDLRFIRCLDVLCDKAEKTTILSEFVGYLDLKIGNNSTAYIAFEIFDKVFLLQCGDLYCTKDNKTLIRLDKADFPNLTLTPDGFPALIVYYIDTENAEAGYKFLACQDEMCSKVNTSIIDSVSILGEDERTYSGRAGTASIAFSKEGLPLIAYYFGTSESKSVKLVECLDKVCNKKSLPVIIDNVGQISGWSVDLPIKLVIRDNDRWLGYHFYTSKGYGLKVAYWRD